MSTSISIKIVPDASLFSVKFHNFLARYLHICVFAHFLVRSRLLFKAVSRRKSGKYATLH